MGQHGRELGTLFADDRGGGRQQRRCGGPPADEDWPPPAGRVLDAVVGGDESGEFLRQSRIIAEHWSSAGVATRYEAIAGANHFTVIEPLADPDSAIVNRLLELMPK